MIGCGRGEGLLQEHSGLPGAPVTEDPRCPEEPSRVVCSGTWSMGAGRRGGSRQGVGSQGRQESGTLVGAGVLGGTVRCAGPPTGMRRRPSQQCPQTLLNCRLGIRLHGL